jgi:hypothetical protein
MKTELTISVRPARHVYFIDENDLQRFKEVACYCCTQWGGINNLIIPITALKDVQDVTVAFELQNCKVGGYLQ